LDRVSKWPMRLDELNKRCYAPDLRQLEGYSNAFCYLCHLWPNRSHPCDVAVYVRGLGRAQSGDHVTLMLFADAAFVAVEGAGAKLVPVGPPNRYEEVAAHPNVTLLACKPCVEARGLSASVLDKRVRLAGMNEFHAAAKEPDTRVVNF